MAPHTWSYLGDTVSDATHQMYYRGQRIKEAYYRGEKIWGSDELSTFRVLVGTTKSAGYSNYRFRGDRDKVYYGKPLQVAFKGEHFEYSIGDGEHVVVDGSYDDLTSVEIITSRPSKQTVVYFYGLERLGHLDFSYSSYLSEILDPLPSMPMCESMGKFLYCCTMLANVPENLFWNNPQLLNFDYCFAYTKIGESSNLASLFANNTLARSFIGTFIRVTFPSGIPYNMFHGLINVRTFQECFAKTSIGKDSNGTYIYDTLFSDCPDTLNFINTFALSDLRTIPEALFYNNQNVTRFIGCFVACQNLTSIPAGLFQYCTEAVDFAACFEGCTKLRSIPASLFQNNLKAEAFNECFFGCSALTSIPSGLFAYNHNAYDFDYTFKYCSKVKSIPSSLFPSLSNHMNDGKLTFAHCFEQCTSLTSIPDDLFSWFSNHVHAVSAQPLAIGGAEQSRLFEDQGIWQLESRYWQYQVGMEASLNDLKGEIYHYSRYYVSYVYPGDSYADIAYHSIVKPRYSDRIIWSSNNAFDALYAYYGLTAYSEFVAGTFQYTFFNCYNITGEIPSSFWDNVVFYGNNSSYAPRYKHDFDPTTTVYHQGHYNLSNPTRFSCETPHCNNGQEAFRLLQVVLMVGACFGGDELLTNFYDLPQMFLADYTWYAYWET